jgi:hypothetical protein
MKQGRNNACIHELGHQIIIQGHDETCCSPPGGNYSCAMYVSYNPNYFNFCNKHKWLLQNSHF